MDRIRNPTYVAAKAGTYVRTRILGTYLFSQRLLAVNSAHTCCEIISPLFQQEKLRVDA